MENNQLIQFKKERDLGAIISDTFNFLRTSWRGYFGTVIRIAGPAFILMIISMAFYMISMGDLFSVFSDNNDLNSMSDSNFLLMAIAIAVAVISGIAFYVMIHLASLYYIKSYIEHNGVVDREEVSRNVRTKFFSFFGLGIAVVIMLLFATMLCFFPGIWLWVILSLATSIMVFEGKGISDTISHSFALVKEHWWETFGVLFVVALLVGIMGQAFSVPSLIYSMIKTGVASYSQDPTEIFGIFSDPIYLALMVFSYVGQFFLASISIVATVLVYYDLNEQKNLTGTMETIDSIGQ